ncbi:outer membrane beta-barrel protein [Helicobacter sp. 11S03491-1]|uniref:outer membrane beta-barrel protein n=1 Tax=Helicobacter sp. 11S03491-1 TaxID=1476196 RepID=UPI000BA631DF|nr:outer membrane beta-barrel protein [Helicobacter sp. 11S03491-1]PAF42062.1 hypothetical protein BKH45_05640 [Helicobacter sp. 11S03491-1]
MKKFFILLFFILMVSVNASDKENKLGIFIGLNIGEFGLFKKSGLKSLDTQSHSQNSADSSMNGVDNLGLRIGYQVMGSYNGVCFYGHMDYSNFNLDFYGHKNVSMIRYGAYVDYLLNLLETGNSHNGGIFLGVGYEWIGGSFGKYIEDLPNSSESISVEKNLHGFLMNIGLANIFFDKHRVEVGVKFPFYVLYFAEYKLKNPANTGSLDIFGDYYVSYSYIF